MVRLLPPGATAEAAQTRQFALLLPRRPVPPAQNSDGHPQQEGFDRVDGIFRIHRMYSARHAQPNNGQACQA